MLVGALRIDVQVSGWPTVAFSGVTWLCLMKAGPEHVQWIMLGAVKDLLQRWTLEKGKKM